MIKKKKTYQGLQKNIRKLKTPKIDTWQNEYADKEYLISLEIAEFTCVCPKTGLPDFATIYIDYVPSEKCVELKSLKEYFFFFRDIGIFHEHFVNRLLDDFVKAASPREVGIRGEFNLRGGIKTTVEANYIKE